MTSQERPTPETAPEQDRTLRLDGPVPPDPAAAATVRLPSADVPAFGEEAESATLLDEEVWATPVSTVKLAAAPAETTTVKLSDAPAGTAATVKLSATPATPATPADTVGTVELSAPAVAQPEPEPAEATGEPGADGLRRFGPGVPGAAGEVPALAAAVWHGTVRPGEPTEAEAPKPRRRRRWWLLPLVVLLAVLGWLFWQGSAKPLSVTAVSVRTDQGGPSCDGTETVTGTLRTEGRGGTVTYRWRRSDGTVSADMAQPVPKGSHQTDVTLRWTFEGKGTMAATATLEVLSPDSRSASAAFTYTCH
ncbi:hypothetical protein ABT095_27050 [Kitasatospora sp. NPDC002227]|uniref:hypothetical protein n=1 Tax=Kitasatospora sp. NPDC002227 TaxID=3154773 RepID=UPI003317A9B2